MAVASVSIIECSPSGSIPTRAQMSSICAVNSPKLKRIDILPALKEGDSYCAQAWH